MTAGSRERLIRVLGAFADETSALTDAELIAEVRERGEDPQALEAEVDAVFADALRTDGQRRLAEARATLDTVQALGIAGSITKLPVASKEQILTRFAANDGTLRGRLTMAARNGEGLSEQEMDLILRDLIELGAIDEEGKPR